MSPQAIAERAYLIWENMGRPEEQALEHWVRAEAELAAKAAVAPKPIRHRARRQRGRRNKI